MGKIQSKTIFIDGLDVHYYTGGQGDPLVVIHGGGGDARTWWDNINELSKKYTVYAPDLPGYGGSEPLIGEYFIPELAEFIEKFAANLGLERFNLVGHSLGGGVALDYALRTPNRVKKLVLVSSLCLGREIALWVRVLSLPAILRTVGVITMAAFRGIKWIIKNLWRGMEFVIPFSPASITIGGSVTTFKEQRMVLAHRFSELMAPTLLVWGARDNVVPVRHAYVAAESIPDCQLKVFEKRGHNVHREDVGEFSQVVRGFLN